MKFTEKTYNQLVLSTDSNLKASVKINLLTESDSSAAPKEIAELVEKSLKDKAMKSWPLVGEELQLLVTVPELDAEKLRLVGAKLYSELSQNEVDVAAFAENTTLTENQMYWMLEGMTLSSYRFDKYFKKKNEAPIKLVVPTQVSSGKVEELNHLMDAVSLTKTMVNEPLNGLNSVRFSEIAVEAGEKYGFDVEVLAKKQIEALKMGGLLGVNKGSHFPPTFTIMTHKPANAKNKKPLVLVGKGVTFDTGGYSLKISGYMANMKSDMAGGATVVGVMSAIAANDLPYYVVGLVPATENMISPEAMVVDDVLTTMDGTTVEVGNTDAEGRLILCDALSYAKKFDPELVVDMATLTGASVAITGDFGIAVLGNSQENIDALSAKGEEVYERLIQLPLWDEYKEMLKSNIADLKNIGGPIGGVSTSAAFLEHFTDYPWVHLDIAGISFAESGKGYRQSGATGSPLRLMYEFIKERAL